MNDEQIISSIDKFISDRLYHFAVMLDGQWGCGKTYFIEQKLIPHIKQTNYKGLNPPDVNYISLYGLKDPNEIADVLCANAIRTKISETTGRNLEGKGAQLASVVVKKLLHIGSNAVGAPDDTLKSIAAILPNYDNNVIIFDDLERCGCDINSVLGYINNFVEHSDASVIIVANETEIGKWQLEHNVELQMLVALNERMKFETAEQKEAQYYANLGGGQYTQSGKLSPTEVEEIRSSIFHDNTQYLKIKEKVIGLTIQYEPVLKDVYVGIVTNAVKEHGLTDMILSIIDELVDIAKDEEHRNIRTFQMFLEKISTIYKCTLDKTTPIMSQIIKYTWRSSIRYMKGEQGPQWDGDYGYQQFGIGFGPNRNLLGFKFVDDLIEKNSYEPEYINAVVVHVTRKEEANGHLADDPILLIAGWYLTDDAQIGEWLNHIEQNVVNGTYSTSLYINIIRYVSELMAYHICEEAASKVIEGMKVRISTAEPKDIEPFDREQFWMEGEPNKLYRAYVREIGELIDGAMGRSEKSKWEEIINCSDWGERLYDLVRKERVITGHSFIFWIDPEVIVEKVLSSSNDQVFQFRRALAETYNAGTYYEKRVDDYNNLKQIEEVFANEKPSEAVKANYLRWICNDIEKYLTLIMPQKMNKRTDENAL